MKYAAIILMTPLDSTHKLPIITGDERAFEVPLGYSKRLHQYLATRLSGQSHR
jgi:hypothetical protein